MMGFWKTCDINLFTSRGDGNPIHSKIWCNVVPDINLFTSRGDGKGTVLGVGASLVLGEVRI